MRRTHWLAEALSASPPQPSHRSLFCGARLLSETNLLAVTMSRKTSLFSNIEMVKANHITPPMASLNSTIIFEAGCKRYVTTEAIPVCSYTLCDVNLKSDPLT